MSYKDFIKKTPTNDINEMFKVLKKDVNDLVNKCNKGLYQIEKALKNKKAE